METRCVSTDDIYACPAWSHWNESSQLISRKMIRSLLSYRWASSRDSDRESKCFTKIRSSCYLNRIHASKVGFEAFDAAHRSICRSAALISSEAERRVHNNHIGDSRFSIDKVLDLITYLFPLHWYRQTQTRARHASPRPLVRSFHFPIFVSHTSRCSTDHETTPCMRIPIGSTCAFPGFSVVSMKNRIIFSHAFSNMWDASVSLSLSWSSSYFLWQKKQILFSFYSS